MSRRNQSFFSNLLTNTNHLIISDSIYNNIRLSDISYDTRILSYASATIIDLGQTVEQYSSGAKVQSLIFHAGHNSIDKAVSGVAALSQLCETVTKAIKKLKPHRVPLFEILQVNNGVNRMVLKLSSLSNWEILLWSQNGTLKWTKVEVLKCNITTFEISNDGVHLNLAGYKKLSRVFGTIINSILLYHNAKFHCD